MRRKLALALGLALLAGGAGADALDQRTIPFAPTLADQAAVQALAGRSTAAFDYVVFNSEKAGALPYRLLKPSGAGPLPLVIVLHGSGEMGTDNKAQMGPFAAAWGDPAIRARFPAYVVVPQFPVRSADYAPDVDGQPYSHPGVSFPALIALVDSLSQTLPIDRSRIYVTGFSMGASTSLQALLQRPDLFAAAVAFSPVPPRRSLAPRLAKKSIMLVHGSADTENPFAGDRLWAHALVAAGGRPKFVVYEGMDHRVAPDMIVGAEWRDWLFAQRLK